MRWLACLLMTLAAEAMGYPLALILPLFAEWRKGPVNNGKHVDWGWRLPRRLAWLDTPDNSLEGDVGHCRRHAGDSWYWQATCWLWRNRAYGLKWGPLAAPMNPDARRITGDLKVNRNNGHYGLLRITMGSYWQWKYVKPIGSTGWCLMLNFGWLLDDDSKPRALFLFSPRVCKIKAK